MAKLKDFCTINPKAPVLADDLEVSFVPMPKVGEQGEFDPSESKEYREVKKGFTNFQNGDVLFAKITPCMENGKGAVAKKLKNGYGFGSTEFHVLRPDNSKVTSEWLYYLTSWSAFRKEAEINMTGSAGQKRVPKTFLENYEVNLPELHEQEKMAVTLDRIHELISLKKEQLAKLDQLVKSRFIELFENEEYEKATVSSVLNTGFWLMPATPEFVVNGEVPYITSKNIKNRTIDFDNVKYISREAYKSISANRPTQKGDILISMIGTLGQTAVIQDDREFYGQNLYLLRLNNAIVNTTYFCEFFNSDTAQYKLQGKRNQSTQAYLKANHVEDLILPLPPMKLQEQFAAFVEQTDKSKLAIQQSLDKLELLKKSLMQEYFG